MNWLAQIDAYCERTDPAYWSEPINAVSNAAFLIAALAMWLRVRRRNLPVAELMSIALAAVGVASYLWHTEARAWAGAADSLSILAFILIYLHAASRDYLELGAWAAALCTAAFVPYAIALGWMFGQLPFFEISSFYWPLVPLMLGYGLALRNLAPRTGRGLHVAAALLTLSLIARSLDENERLCAALPVGTHFHLASAQRRASGMGHRGLPPPHACGAGGSGLMPLPVARTECPECPSISKRRGAWRNWPASGWKTKPCRRSPRNSTPFWASWNN